MTGVLVVIASAGGMSSRDGIDAALAAIAYEHSVSVLLIADGVCLLSALHKPDAQGLPDLARGLDALLHHGAVAIAASSECMRVRGISNPAVAVQRLGADGLSALIAGHRHVQRF
jgi:sulfur relay (sulfurtransferase) DsrF/TusC family protein